MKTEWLGVVVPILFSLACIVCVTIWIGEGKKRFLTATLSVLVVGVGAFALGGMNLFRLGNGNAMSFEETGKRVVAGQTYELLWRSGDQTNRAILRVYDPNRGILGRASEVYFVSLPNTNIYTPLQKFYVDAEGEFIPIPSPVPVLVETEKK